MENNFDLKKFLIENREPKKELISEQGGLTRFINRQVAKLGRALGFKEREFDFLSLDQIKQNINRLPETGLLSDKELAEDLSRKFLSLVEEIATGKDMLGQKIKKKEHEGVTYYDANDIYRFFTLTFPDLVYQEDIRDGFAYYDAEEDLEYNKDLFTDMLALSLTGAFSNIVTSLPDGYKNFRMSEAEHNSIKLTPEEEAAIMGAEDDDYYGGEDLRKKLTPVSQVIDEDEEMLNEALGMLIALGTTLAGTVITGKFIQQIRKARRGEYGDKEKKAANSIIKFVNDLHDKIGNEDY